MGSEYRSHEVTAGLKNTNSSEGGMMLRSMLILGMGLLLASCDDPGDRVDEMRTGDCGFDESILDGKLSRDSWMMTRGGVPCAENRISSDRTSYIASVGKSFAAVTFGFVNYDSRNGPDPISPDDRASKWIRGYSPDCRLAEILSMSGHRSGCNRFSYDTVGTTQINELSEALNKAIRNNDLADGLDDYVHNRVMPALEMEDSDWARGRDNKIFAYSLNSTVRDMLRFGQLINDGGVYKGERYLSEEYASRQIHAANPRANTGMGFLTWLNARNWQDISGRRSAPDLSCAPVVLQESDLDANGKPKGNLNDVGLWLSRGQGGHFMIGHPGLDMVMAIKGYSGRPNNFWEALRPAMVEASGLSERQFCNQYASGSYSLK